ncbi:hypothetical protein RFI_24921 [Reticulomyxa filosa]|uniref:Uncharacterized protein n=1 Tax=Reticulomyxa filosa TaxID=46433 RepID=X6MFN2_RETFI|nr:hypothetical protein RFI_24921 [Reticulomyxa filosa]|eukprot:ETO12456.1 hypothetical protein RFI_24921 [Reticulomyxa filosa]
MERDTPFHSMQMEIIDVVTIQHDHWNFLLTKACPTLFHFVMNRKYICICHTYIYIYIFCIYLNWLVSQSTERLSRFLRNAPETTLDMIWNQLDTQRIQSIPIRLLRSLLYAVIRQYYLQELQLREQLIPQERQFALSIDRLRKIVIEKLKVIQSPYGRDYDRTFSEKKLCRQHFDQFGVWFSKEQNNVTPTTIRRKDLSPQWAKILKEVSRNFKAHIASGSDWKDLMQQVLVLKSNFFFFFFFLKKTTTTTTTKSDKLCCGILTQLYDRQDILKYNVPLRDTLVSFGKWLHAQSTSTLNLLWGYLNSMNKEHLKEAEMALLLHVCMNIWMLERDLHKKNPYDHDALTIGPSRFEHHSAGENPTTNGSQQLPSSIPVSHPPDTYHLKPPTTSISSSSPPSPSFPSSLSSFFSSAKSKQRTATIAVDKKGHRQSNTYLQPILPSVSTNVSPSLSSIRRDEASDDLQQMGLLLDETPVVDTSSLSSLISKEDEKKLASAHYFTILRFEECKDCITSILKIVRKKIENKRKFLITRNMRHKITQWLCSSNDPSISYVGYLWNEIADADRLYIWNHFMDKEYNGIVEQNVLPLLKYLYQQYISISRHPGDDNGNGDGATPARKNEEDTLPKRREKLQIIEKISNIRQYKNIVEHINSETLKKWTQRVKAYLIQEFCRYCFVNQEEFHFFSTWILEVYQYVQICISVTNFQQQNGDNNDNAAKVLFTKAGSCITMLFVITNTIIIFNYYYYILILSQLFSFSIFCYYYLLLIVRKMSSVQHNTRGTIFVIRPNEQSKDKKSVTRSMAAIPRPIHVPLDSVGAIHNSAAELYAPLSRVSVLRLTPPSSQDKTPLSIQLSNSSCSPVKTPDNTFSAGDEKGETDEEMEEEEEEEEEERGKDKDKVKANEDYENDSKANGKEKQEELMESAARNAVSSDHIVNSRERHRKRAQKTLKSQSSSDNPIDSDVRENSPTRERQVSQSLSCRKRRNCKFPVKTYHRQSMSRDTAELIQNMSKNMLMAQIQDCSAFVKFLEKCSTEALDCVWKKFDTRGCKLVPLHCLEDMIYALMVLHLNNSKSYSSVKQQGGTALLPTREQCQSVVDEYAMVIRQHLTEDKYLHLHDFHHFHLWLKGSNDDVQLTDKHNTKNGTSLPCNERSTSAETQTTGQSGAMESGRAKSKLLNAQQKKDDNDRTRFRGITNESLDFALVDDDGQQLDHLYSLYEESIKTRELHPVNTAQMTNNASQQDRH